MCTVSMVMDHYREPFKTYEPYTVVTTPSITPEEIASLQKIIKEFKEAVKAAKTLDKLMKQADCVDPEKVKLEKRVARLEKLVRQQAKSL